MNPDVLKAAIRQRASELGFAAIGFTTADPFPETEAIMHERLGRGLLAGLPWFTARRIEASCRPESQLPQARTLLSVALPYFAPDSRPNPDQRLNRGSISRHAWGPDYHPLIREKLVALIEFIGEEIGYPPTARTYVDSGWLPERAVAARSGLGFIGKNTNLIVPGWGSSLFLGEILMDFPMAADSRSKRDCGTCDLCLSACPTGALQAPYELDVNRCLSFLTIEWRGAIPTALRPLLGNRLFGCDACQDVCPWNRHTPNPPLPELIHPDDDWPYPQLSSLLSLTEASFRQRFGRSALARAKQHGLQRNAAIVAGNLRSAAAVPALLGLLESQSALARQHAAWALGQFGGAEVTQALGRALASEKNDDVRTEIELALGKA